MKKKVLIYNPFSKTGHLDSWLYLISKSFDRNDIEIDVLSPDVRVLKKANLNFNAISFEKVPIGNALGLYLSFWDLMDFLYVMRMKAWNGISVKLQPGNVRYCVKILLWTFLKIIPASLLRSQIYSSKTFVEQLNQAVKNRHYDCIFVTYFDFLTSSKLFWKLFDKMFDQKIYGIKFDTDNLASHGLLNSKRLKGIFLLDSKFVDQLQALNYPSHFLPDISFNEVSMKDENVRYILDKAKERTVVFLGGAIGKQKNISLWVDLVKSADASKFFFLQAGKINRSTISEIDLESIDQIKTRENLLILDRYFEDEKDFNQLIFISNIIFAAYKNFNLSSNLVTKAIFLRKPILVSSNTLMSEIVEKYNLGKSIEQTSVTEALRGIEELRSHKLSEEAYMTIEKDFSFEKFQTTILSVLN